MFPKGTSMLPLIVQKRDSVVLMRNDSVGARKHDIAFYRRSNGQFVLHRVMKICNDGTYVMCGDNQLFLEKGIKREQIIAYVSGICRKNKSVKMNGLAYRTYVFLRTKRPIRWLCFIPRRIRGKLGRIFRRIFPKHS